MTWIDEAPVTSTDGVPRGTPFVGESLTGKPIRGVLLGDTYKDEDGNWTCLVSMARLGQTENAAARMVNPKVDLDESLGFAYVLHRLSSTAEGRLVRREWVARWIVGMTTPLDRIDLTRALNHAIDAAYDRIALSAAAAKVAP